MTNKQLQEFLQQYPDDMLIKLMTDKYTQSVVEMDEDNIIHSSESSYVDTDAPEDEWDTEDGKIMLGDGRQYLLFNPIIL